MSRRKCTMAIRVVLGFLAVATLANQARATTVPIAAGRDNTIFAESLNSGGAATTFFVGRNNSAGVRRALIWFDVAAFIPAGATIEAVTLSLYMDGAAQTETKDREVALYRLTADWGEGTSGGGGPGGGMGQSPTAGDATWQHR